VTAAVVYDERVKETTATTGTGTFTLAGAVLGFESFSTVFVDQAQVYYSAFDSLGNWEVGQGTFSTGANTLSRDTVIRSSNAGALVNFPGPSTTVFNTAPNRSITKTSPNNVPQASIPVTLQDGDNMLFAGAVVFNTTIIAGKQTLLVWV